jgi:hypothetical protein
MNEAVSGYEINTCPAIVINALGGSSISGIRKN